MTVKELVDSTIEKHKVVVFSKTTCPFCSRAKATLAEYKDVDTEILELDEREDGGAIQDYLLKKTGQRTVPNIFINKQHIGGNDSLQAVRSKGQLDNLLKA
ncbi:hypothetical protein AMATHDRAFT_67504 [Amanita thiersii Skay4041]|uniref:Glutaredoxin domain-containing protein n=1 Tax=Amanita thiersii Skay4041 TaxID=703135 RepID=A0A2A9N9G3_9AGAR|nr:hypothetical protein AMATHDRAFT_67504 [Amanita thiersii Skay4041]